MGNPNYANGFKLTLQPHMLERPLGWKKPQRIFVNSIESDLFHDAVPEEYIQRCFRRHAEGILALVSDPHQAAERLEELIRGSTAGERLGRASSVENEDVTFRMDHLRRTGAAVKFLSVEPLIVRCRTSTSPASTGSSSAANPAPAPAR